MNDAAFPFGKFPSITLLPYSSRFTSRHYTYIIDPSWTIGQQHTRTIHTLLPSHHSPSPDRPTPAKMADQPGAHCGETRPIDRVGLRVSALFVILITSLIGTMFPIITKRVKYLRKRVPGIVFEFGK